MARATRTGRPVVAAAVFNLLNPIPYGLFVGALIFDVTYAISANVFWGKGAAWMITIALFFAIIPRVINLVKVWLPSRYTITRVDRFDFWLNLLGIGAAFINAFVHSRDAYAMVPLNVILSAVTVVLLSIGQFALAFDKFVLREAPRE